MVARLGLGVSLENRLGLILKGLWPMLVLLCFYGCFRVSCKADFGVLFDVACVY